MTRGQSRARLATRTSSTRCADRGSVSGRPNVALREGMGVAEDLASRMADKTNIERRALIAAASGGALSLALTSKRAAAQSLDAITSAASGHFEGSEIQVGDNTIFIRRYGSGAPLLMVHGFPRTSLMWRYVAPQLASNHTVICVDLRGYGRSGVPESTKDHYPYTKRAMGNELVALMDKLGFAKFDLVGHDRGGRVSYRLTLEGDIGNSIDTYRFRGLDLPFANTRIGAHPVAKARDGPFKRACSVTARGFC
jgi:hypothetical protein